MTSPSAGAVDLSLSPSLVDGAVLMNPVTWSVQAHGSPIDHVDFLIDGTPQWTERAPYVFNDDGQLLEPWLLSPGKHVLLARAVTANGRTAETVVHVQTGPTVAGSAGLAGSFVRAVTQADIDRTAGEPGREADVTLPVGTWTVKLLNGLLSFDDPNGSGGGEAFSATATQLTLWGWPQWRLPPDRRGGFCEHGAPGTFAWSLSGTRLQISGGGDCADRDALLIGTWKRAT